MTERLTDEQLRDLRDCAPANPDISTMATELLALRARVAQLEAALEAFDPNREFDGAVLENYGRLRRAALKDAPR